MDERKMLLKQLKKTSKKAKRRYVTLWKVLGIFFLVAAVVFSAAGVAVKMCDQVSKLPYLPSDMILWGIAGVAWVLFLVALCLWGSGKKRWKKSEAYLDYRTMKRAIRDEKKLK